MTTYAEVYKIKEITDKDEIFVNISLSVLNNQGFVQYYDAGYMVIFLKTRNLKGNVGVAWFDEDTFKRFVEKVKKEMLELCDVIRLERGYK